MFEKWILDLEKTQRVFEEVKNIQILAHSKKLQSILKVNAKLF